MTERDVRTRYKALKVAIADLVRRHDPIGLMAMGAPPDEYARETDTIIPQLRYANTAEDVRSVLHQVFVRWFDEETAGPETGYEDLARDVWAVWKELGDTAA